MPARKIDFDTVRAMAATLPGVEEGSMYGSPAVKLRGQLLACLPTHRSAEPGTLAVRIDVDQRDDLVAEDPKTYYLTDHYRPHPIVLVRLARVHRDALRDLLRASWQFAQSTSAARRQRPHRRRRV